MKIIGAFITLVSFVFLWIMYSGYQHVSLVKNFGTEEYVLAEETAVSSTTQLINKFNKENKTQNNTATTTERIVTHIKTPEHVKAVYMSSWVAGSPSIRSRLVKLIEDTELNADTFDNLNQLAALISSRK